MVEPPFLELAYYIGTRGVNAARNCISQSADDSPHVAKMTVPGLVGVSKDEELEVVGGTLILRTEGEVFCGPSSSKSRVLRLSLGKRIYEKFINTAQQLECRYAAITVEYSLEEPQSLLVDSTSLAFRNFYLSSRWVGSTIQQAVELAGPDVYVETTQKGTYISMSPDFNPKRCGISPTESQYRSVAIAGALAKIAHKLLES